MNIELKEDRVLIEPLTPEQKTASGIILVEASETATQLGTVVAVGPGTKEKEVTSKVGDIVHYSEYGQEDFFYDNEKYILTREEQITAKIKK